MKRLIVPLAQTQVDWDRLLSLDLPITRSIDAANKIPGDFVSYIGVLGEMQHPGSHLYAVLQQPGSLLRHLFFSFLIFTDESDLTYIGMNSQLGVTVCETNFVGVVSGTLETWRTAVINLCHTGSPINVREIFNAILEKFEIVGLHRIWFDFEKRSLDDGTFKLCQRSSS